MDILPAAQAIEGLVHEYSKLIFYTIYGLTGDWEESQDLTQDTFHNALKAIDQARRESGANFSPKAWLLRIALNTVRMQRRRRKILRFVPFSRMLQSNAEETEREAQAEVIAEQAARVQPVGYGQQASADPAELVAEQDAVRRTMAKLPEEMRTCLLLSIIGGLSAHEIANLLDLKEAAVRQRLARAKKQFQQEYTHQSGEDIRDTNPNVTYVTAESGGTRILTDKKNQLQRLPIVPSYSWLRDVEYGQELS